MEDRAIITNNDENVANNVVNAKVQDLTEHWKNGELKPSWYYVKNEFGNIFISEYLEDYDYINERVVKGFFTEVSEITEIICEVPSYEEWLGLEEDVDTMTELWKHERSQLSEKIQLIGKLGVQAVDLKSEIQQLKELLKECREYIETEQKMLVKCTPFYKNLMNELLTKIDEVLK